MPKVEKNVGDDPDPSEWLFISLEQKRIDQSKPYDAKKACWVPDEALGYVLGEIKSTKGDLVSVALPGGEVISLMMKPKHFCITLGKFIYTKHEKLENFLGPLLFFELQRSLKRTKIHKH